eukprot:6186758-Pleurochrysis_carterae.AAC.2
MTRCDQSYCPAVLETIRIEVGICPRQLRVNAARRLAAREVQAERSGGAVSVGSSSELGRTRAV